MVRYVMTLTLAVGSDIKWMMNLNLCMIPLRKILEINYTDGSLKQPMAKKILWGVTILFIYHIKGEREGLFRAKER